MPESRASLKILFVAAVCDRRATLIERRYRASLKGIFVIAFGRATFKLGDSIWFEKHER
jgi:hypothetical protein